MIIILMFLLSYTNLEAFQNAQKKNFKSLMRLFLYNKKQK